MAIWSPALWGLLWWCGYRRGIKGELRLYKDANDTMILLIALIHLYYYLFIADLSFNFNFNKIFDLALFLFNASRKLLNIYKFSIHWRVIGWSVFFKFFPLNVCTAHPKLGVFSNGQNTTELGTTQLKLVISFISSFCCFETFWIST